jgi:hypothetical protein
MTGFTIYLPGWELSYPQSDMIAMNVTLTGTVPSVTVSSNKTIIRVQELNSKGNLVPTTTVLKEGFVANPADIAQMISAKESDLRAFRTEIDGKAAMNIPTAAAEERYRSSQTAILNAKNASYSTAQSYLANVTAMIADGERLLDRAWAEKKIADARQPLSQVDSLITYFRVNLSVTDNPRLTAIIVKRENATVTLSFAQEQLNTGNFGLARAKADEAFTIGNASYTDALSLKRELGNVTSTSTGGSFPLSGPVLWAIVGVVVIVIAVAAYLVLRPRDRWGGE